MIRSEHAFASAACMLIGVSISKYIGSHTEHAHQVLDHALEGCGARVADVVGAQPREHVQQVAPLAL